MKMTLWLLQVATIFALTTDVGAFMVPPASRVVPLLFGQTATRKEINHALMMALEKDDTLSNHGVVELVDEEEETKAPPVSAAGAPFLSQGEILQESLNPDLSDPKQTRVIIYIIISLIPVLFLIPLMLGSRDLIPLEALPPVDL
jgi:hypothetical protein